MTMPWDPAELRRQSLDTAATLLACGVDPERSTLFLQSHVPAHAELTWVLACIARMGELRRMVQFKERSRGETETVGVGLFTYPVLQAADVLLYQAHGVPVGEDQRQHIELMRDLAVRFNGMFGETFTVPEAWIPEVGARIMALDDPTQKMSTSIERDGSKLLLVDPPEAIERKVRAAVTDSGREVRSGPDKPAITNLLTIYSVVEGTPVGELEERFAAAGYGEFKAALAETLIAHLGPIRDRYQALVDDPAELDRLIAKGAQRAAEAAEPTMANVRSRTGLGPGAA
jgi:tryptophanyl-tRNA synthetase